MRARTLVVVGVLLATGCDSGAPRAPAVCLDEGPDDGGLESCSAIVLPQMDGREGDPDYLICTTGVALNASGAVAGRTCEQMGFSWSAQDPHGRFVEPPDRFLVDGIRLTAINRAGDVVGMFSPAEYAAAERTFVISSGQMILLPPLVDDSPAAAVDINDHGTIVGQASVSRFVEAAVYWQDGEIHRLDGLDVLGGNYAVAVAVNERGMIVGFSNTTDVAAGMQAFRWDGSGPIEFLPALSEGGSGEPSDVNQAGVVVGGSGSRAVYWDEQGEIHALPDLYDTDSVQALAINDHGVIVGYEVEPPNAAGVSYGEARVWIDGDVYDLEDLLVELPEEYQLRSAVDINDEGQVLAHASIEDGGPIRTVTLLLAPNLDP
jgi:hypothetical protein